MWLNVFYFCFDECLFIMNCNNQNLYLPILSDEVQSVDESLQWRHNGRDSVSNHQPHDCFLNRLFRRRWNKTSKLRVTGLCVGDSSGTGEFPAQMASNAENVSIWWRHHDVADNADKGVNSALMCQVAVPGFHMRIDTYKHPHTHTYMHDVIFTKRDI